MTSTSFTDQILALDDLSRVQMLTWLGSELFDSRRPVTPDVWATAYGYAADRQTVRAAHLELRAGVR